MDLATKIKGMLKQADIYGDQGLLVEARDSYQEVVELIRSQPRVKNKEKLLQGLETKLDKLEAQIHKVDGAFQNPELSEEIQTLIKKLFGFSPAADEDSAALEGAIALTKFGQYPRALTEFEALLDRQSVRLVAAKNILRCHLATDDVAAATARYGRWLRDPRFEPDLLVKIRIFFETLLQQKEVDVSLPDSDSIRLPVPSLTMEIVEPQENEVLDISAVRFQIPQGPHKDRFVDYEVSFQSGNVISILINESDQELIEALRLGNTITTIELTSAVAIFNGTARVLTKNQIKVGPRKGCFSVDLKIQND